MPATTSSPWALRRYSPLIFRSPVEASRVKATPVPESRAHVAEDHRLHVDRGAEVVRDLLDLAVAERALVVPRVEDGADRQLELLHRLVGERLAGLALHVRLELRDDVLERRSRQLPVLLHASGLLRLVEDAVELLAVELEHDVREHHDEAAIGVVGEALVARRVDERAQRRLVEAEVEHGVHHARHRELGAAADRDQQRRAGVAELLAGGLLDSGERVAHLVHEAGGELHAALAIGVAGDGRDREAGGHRYAEVRHLGQVGALAAEQVLLVLVAFVEQVDVLLAHRSLPSNCGRRRARRDDAPCGTRAATRPCAELVVVSSLWTGVMLPGLPRSTSFRPSS